MYIADTNMIVRLLVRDDEEQYRDTLHALMILEQRNEPCYVPDVVWIEACWVLQKIYKLDKRSISKALMNLLHTEVIVLTWNAKDFDKLKCKWLTPSKIIS
jgi:predicted nucleic acid-binding protein